MKDLWRITKFDAEITYLSKTKVTRTVQHIFVMLAYISIQMVLMISFFQEYIHLEVSDTYESLWQKTYEALAYIQTNYGKSFDYMLKVLCMMLERVLGGFSALQFVGQWCFPTCAFIVF